MNGLRILGCLVLFAPALPECGPKKQAGPDPTATLTPPASTADAGPKLSQLYPPTAATWDKIQNTPAPTSSPRDGGARDGSRRRDGGSSDYERALELSEVDTEGARSILEPKVMGGKGTADEVRLMEKLCKTQQDQACLEILKKKYPPKR